MRDRLIDNTILLWTHPSSAEPPMRAILELSGATAPSLYHHFDSLYHLYCSAHEVAIDRAERWFAERASELEFSAPLRPEAFPALLATLIDRWCEECRSLALARFDCLLAALRSGEETRLSSRWTTLWRNFWRGIAERCGLSPAADAISALALGLTLTHLLRTNVTIDRCSLQELGRTWLSWHRGHLGATSDWQTLALASANYIDTPPEIPRGKALTIANAAADLLVEQGTGHLTHRAIAQRAGISTGAVAHYFRAADDLMRAAFAVIFWRSVPERTGMNTPEPPPLSWEEVRRGLTAFVITPTQKPAAMIGWIELHLSMARDPAFSALAARMRYRGGHMIRRYIDPLLSNGAESGLTDRALLTTWIIGVQLQSAAMTNAASEDSPFIDWLVPHLSQLKAPNQNIE